MWLSAMVEVYRRSVSSLAATRPGAAVLRRCLPVLDRLALVLTRGRHNFTEHVLPTLVLTSTGSTTGRPRAKPLCYLRDGDALIVVGSNWGQKHHPAWTSNLLATPRGSVLIGGRDVPVEAAQIRPEEWETWYRRFEAMSPNYRSYRDWAGGRRPRIFRLTPFMR